MENEELNEISEIKKQMQSVTFAAYQALDSRYERQEKRLIRVIVLLILLLVSTNGAWLLYESQCETVYETTETTITQDNDAGYNNYIGNNGDIINGETDNNN